MFWVRNEETEPFVGGLGGVGGDICETVRKRVLGGEGGAITVFHSH